MDGCSRWGGQASGAIAAVIFYLVLAWGGRVVRGGSMQGLIVIVACLPYNGWTMTSIVS